MQLQLFVANVNDSIRKLKRIKILDFWITPLSVREFAQIV